MSATSDKWRALADRLLNGNGTSTIAWKRRALTANGPAGTVTQTSIATYSVRAAQLDARSDRLSGSESWRQARVRLIVSAASLPFAPETASGAPEPHYDDIVTWLGADMRVTFFDQWAAPGGPGAAPAALAYLVGLGA